MKIAFVGSGVMGEAIISGILSKRLVGSADIHAGDAAEERLTALESKYNIHCTSDNRTAIKNCDIIVLSIKPQTLPGVLEELKGSIEREQLVLSIIAGATIDTLSTGLAHNSLVRVMPNTPAQIGHGMSVWTATDAVSDAQKKKVRELLQALGEEIYFPDEKYIDMATAVSGSGPAYVFLVIESLIDAAVQIGIPRHEAEVIVLQTVAGSARFAKESKTHPAELRNRVTSPGGTTAEALFELEEGGLRGMLARAVVAAYQKARTLSQRK